MFVFIKKHKILIIIVTVIVITMTVVISLPSVRAHFVWEFMLYDHIQYNGYNYYRHSDIRKVGERIDCAPVYLVMNSGKIYESPHPAWAYERYEDPDYLFFDGVGWKKSYKK